MDKIYRRPAIKSSIVRIILFLAIWLLVFVLFELVGFIVFPKLFETIFEQSEGYYRFSRSILLVFSFILVALFKAYIDRRPWSHWFSLVSHKFDLFYGFLFAGALLTLGTLGLVFFQQVDLLYTPMPSESLLKIMALYIVAATLEELVVRGYVLSNLMAGMNHYIALLLSSLLFMCLHSVNNHLTPLAFFNLFLAGNMIGLSFLYTRNLYFPIGLHIGWNFFQGSVYGFEVSGLPFQSIYTQKNTLQNVLTGGNFGFEGSTIATILILVATGIIYLFFKPYAQEEY